MQLSGSTVLFNSLAYDPVTNPNSLCTPVHPCTDLARYGVLTSATSMTFKNDAMLGVVGIDTSTTLTTVGSNGNYAVLGGPIDYADPGSTRSVTVYTDSTHTATTSVMVPATWTMAARTEIDTAPYADSSMAATIASATTDYLTMASYWSNQTTYPVNQLNVSGQASTKLGVTAGVTTIDITGQGIVYYTFGTNVNTSVPVTIIGGPTDMIGFQVPSTRTVSLGAQITLQGGMLPDNVLWNITNTATTNVLNINGAVEVEGDFIVAGKYSVANSLVYGRIFGGAGALAWNANGNETSVPEPSTWVSGVSGLAAALWLARRRIRPRPCYTRDYTGP